MNSFLAGPEFSESIPPRCSWVWFDPPPPRRGNWAFEVSHLIEIHPERLGEQRLRREQLAALHGSQVIRFPATDIHAHRRFSIHRPRKSDWGNGIRDV